MNALCISRHGSNPAPSLVLSATVVRRLHAGLDEHAPTAPTASPTTSSPPLAKRPAGAWSRRRTRACGHLPVKESSNADRQGRLALSQLQPMPLTGPGRSRTQASSDIRICRRSRIRGPTGSCRVACAGPCRIVGSPSRPGSTSTDSCAQDRWYSHSYGQDHLSRATFTEVVYGGPDAGRVVT
jgi:hypothetical protein